MVNFEILRFLLSIYSTNARKVEKLHILEPHKDAGAGEALRSVRCSGCAFLIRSSLYYECSRGCDEPWVLLAHSWQMTNDRRDSSSFPTATCNEKGHITMCKPPVTFLKPAPRRMCQECISKNWKSRDCNREHFHKVFHKNPYGQCSSLNPDLDRISQLTSASQVSRPSNAK